MREYAKIVTLLAILATLTQCVPAAIVSAGGAGAELGMQDRTVGRSFDDLALKASVSKKFFDKDINDLFKNVEVDVIEARVFLTGSVKSTETEINAVKLAWQVPRVKEVINEIQVDDQSGLLDYARDAWIQRQIGTQMLFTKGIRSTNYTVECVNGVVYLMGLAYDENELRKVNDIASRTKYVKEVINHAVLKNDPRRG
jgi:osmotically-inducible protein OsmY